MSLRKLVGRAALVAAKEKAADPPIRGFRTVRVEDADGQVWCVADTPAGEMWLPWNGRDPLPYYHSDPGLIEVVEQIVPPPAEG